MANKSVLELVVETGKWDSGLKKGKKALDDFTTASGGLQQALGKDSDKMQKFVQMMGSMESRAKTAKGQMNDYKGTIEQLTMQYNRMTDAQQKTIGQDYLRAIDQLRQKYQAVSHEVQQMNHSLQQTPSTPKGGGFLSGLGGKMDGALQVFAGNVMTKAAGAVANLGLEIAGAVQQGIELAKQGEGIRMAFERLGRGDLLAGLREATHGTVTDVELMKAAVKFNDFKLPLDQLGTMLAFAQQKAKDTGESVDYMVESITNGLGRQSKPILDNLGISAKEIEERMKSTGDFTKAVGEIIREQMSKAGDYVETAAERATKADVDLKNAMDDLGRTLMPLQEAGVSMFNSWKIAAVKYLNSALKPLINALTTAGALRQEVERRGGNKRISQDVKWIANSDDKERSYNNLLRGYMEEEMKALNALNEAKKGGRGSIGIYEKEYNAAKQLRKDFQAAVKPILITVDVDTKTVEDAAKKVKAAAKSAKAKPEEIYPEDSLRGLTRDLQELQKAQQLVTNNGDWRGYEDAIKAVQERIKELKGELSNIEAGNMTALGKIEGVSLADMAAGRVKGKGMKDLGLGDVPTRDSIIAKGQKNISNFKGYKQPEEKTDIKINDALGQLTSSVSSMVNGIESLGIKVPEGLKNVLGAMQTITMILASIEAFQKVGTILGLFSNGGVVKAAGGYHVPGRTFSGDMIPARLNAGETVLNQAQAGVIANALQDREFGGGSGMMQPYVDGEKIFLGMNNTSKRMGRGEIVTTGTLRRLGLI